MPLYSIDVRIVGTAYVRADDPAAALAAAKTLDCTCLALPDGLLGEIEISGRRYNDPRLPDVSLSPVATCWGPLDGATPERVDDDPAGPAHPGAIVRNNLEGLTHARTKPERPGQGRDDDDADLAEAADGETCEACGRESLDCSRKPCPAVVEDRGDIEPIPASHPVQPLCPTSSDYAVAEAAELRRDLERTRAERDGIASNLQAMTRRALASETAASQAAETPRRFIMSSRLEN